MLNVYLKHLPRREIRIVLQYDGGLLRIDKTGRFQFHGMFRFTFGQVRIFAN